MPTDQAASTAKLRSAAFYIFLATVVLAPLAFLPTSYIALELVKTVVIVFGTLISLFLYAFAAFKERTAVLPPKSILWTSALIILSLVLSSAFSIQAAKSFFGQGFESGTAGFIVALFLSALVAFAIVRERAERAAILYVGMAASFAILYIIHALRFAFGQGFLSLSVMTTLTSTILGNWYGLGIYAMLMVIILLAAVTFLPLSRRFKAVYWVLIVLAGFAAAVINSRSSWVAATAVLLGMAICMFFSRSGTAGKGMAGFSKRIAWVPLAVALVAAVFAWRGAEIMTPTIAKLNAGYTELSLPWQMTLDVTAGAIKNYPLFGVGPNHFTQAFLAYKPAVINTTDAWAAEFNSGFALIPTFVATQGILGAVAWLLFLVFLGILGAQALKRLPQDPHARFTVASSYMGSVFLWLVLLLYVPSHALFFYALVMTGIFAGAAVHYGLLRPVAYAPQAGSRSYKTMPSALALCMLLLVVLAFFYVKTTVALAYFGAGVKQLSVSNNPVAADADFQKALSFDRSDLYLQARAESGLAEARMLASSASSSASASSTAALIAQITKAVEQSTAYAQAAVSYDPSNYYNYLSEARVYEFASSVNMPGAYAAAVQAYTAAIAHNPQNPALYLSLAQLQVSQKNYDDALKTVGAALQIKNDYLDGIFLLSQIEAAQGNLKDAITAAQVAVQINPQDPTINFQLGLLDYENQDFASAAKALETAIAAQPDYANASYFLGLSYVRLGRNADAIAQFQHLVATNPNNQEVALILANLEAGRSPFVNEAPPATPPEKRATLPIRGGSAR